MTVLRAANEKIQHHRKLAVTLDLILFKLCWVLLVVFQTGALAAATAMMLVRLGLSDNLRHRLRDAAVVLGTGLAMDCLLSVAGLYRFDGGGLLPIWMGLIWVSFALTLPLGRTFLPGTHPLLLVLGGALTGVLAYLAGYLLHGISFGLPLWQALLVIGVVWSLYLPMIVFTLCRLWQRDAPA